MLNQEFCENLEFALTKAFSTSSNPSLEGFWCDGILLSTNETDYSQKRINDTQKVCMFAFIGKDGQEKYELTLHFWEKSLSKYANNLDISSCIPTLNDSDWITIDVKLKK
jgi:hypothetical protein